MASQDTKQRTAGKEAVIALEQPRMTMRDQQEMKEEANLNVKFSQSFVILLFLVQK